MSMVSPETEKIIRLLKKREFWVEFYAIKSEFWCKKMKNVVKNDEKNE